MTSAHTESSINVAQVSHNGRQLNLGILPPQLPPGTRWGWQRRLEVIDSLSPQNHMSSMGIYPTPLDTTITIEASSAWTRRTNGT